MNCWAKRTVEIFNPLGRELFVPDMRTECAGTALGRCQIGCDKRQRLSLPRLSGCQSQPGARLFRPREHHHQGLLVEPAGAATRRTPKFENARPFRRPFAHGDSTTALPSTTEAVTARKLLN